MKNKKSKNIFSIVSTGLLVTATGLGAGDIAMAAYAGSNLGISVIFAAIIGALLKYFLNEGIGRWQLASGTTIVQGLIQKLPKAVSIYFGSYLIFWSFLVSGTLISFTGMVSQTIFPLNIANEYAIAIYGGIHSFIAVFLIFMGGFKLIEQLMKFLIGIMFSIVLISAIIVCPSWSELLEHTFNQNLFGRIINMDNESTLFIIALIGGIGGSLTLLCYSYWLKEKEGSATTLREIKIDLGVAYTLTALFGIAIIIIAASVNPQTITGFNLVISISDKLGDILGVMGKYAFIFGFWGAVFSSMLGVWQGVPYLFSDFIQEYKKQNDIEHKKEVISTKSYSYRLFLLYMAFPPILLTIFEKPDWIGIAYAVSGAFFMPFLIVLLLYMNNKKEWVNDFKNNWITNLMLVISLIVFLLLI